MQRIHIDGSSGSSQILVGERLENLPRYLPQDKTVLITDTHVKELYGDLFPVKDIVEIGCGEGIKNLDTVRRLYERLIDLEVDRSSFIVGVGGGVVCDVVGFVAATYMRGVRFGFVSTTLLSQVDASVGGKNGVNLGGYKNMIGVFCQPEFVICDLAMLNTLPTKEIHCGMGEIVKHAVISNVGMFEFLEKNYNGAVAMDLQVIEKLVYQSVMIKSDVVNRDEKEAGQRRVLNFGHTFGHGIEKTTELSHGEAVAVGMVLAGALSTQMGLLKPSVLRRVCALLEKLQLPTHIPTNPELIIDALHKDKKRQGEHIHFVALEDIGRVAVRSVSLKRLEEAVRRWSSDHK